MRKIRSLFNAYGDLPLKIHNGYGIDIACQRIDGLDRRALARILELLERIEPVRFLEIGSGMGFQGYRASLLGASVRLIDFRPPPTLKYFKRLFPAAQIEFLKGNALLADLNGEKYDIVFSQRTLHYFQYSDAITLAYKIRQAGKPGMRLYISASGINSELADNYSGKLIDIQDRYCNLSPQMAQKHNIAQKVCLYSKQELVQLFESTGFSTIDSFESDFGNVKAEFSL